MKKVLAFVAGLGAMLALGIPAQADQVYHSKQIPLTRLAPRPSFVSRSQRDLWPTLARAPNSHLITPRHTGEPSADRRSHLNSGEAALPPEVGGSSPPRGCVARAVRGDGG
jgi:hypothetical protein